MAIEDARVFGEIEAVRRTLSLSGTQSWSPRYSLLCGTSSRGSVGERETDGCRSHSHQRWRSLLPLTGSSIWSSNSPDHKQQSGVTNPLVAVSNR